MEPNHPHLTTQKTLYVEISLARHRAELVTDDRETLRERHEAPTGERIAALEATEPTRTETRQRGAEPDGSVENEGGGTDSGERSIERERTVESNRVEHQLGL